MRIMLLVLLRNKVWNGNTFEATRMPTNRSIQPIVRSIPLRRIGARPVLHREIPKRTQNALLSRLSLTPVQTADVVVEHRRVKQALQHRTAVTQTTRVLQPFGPRVGLSDGSGRLLLRPSLPDSAGFDFAEGGLRGEVVLSTASRAHLEVVFDVGETSSSLNGSLAAEARDV